MDKYFTEIHRSGFMLKQKSNGINSNYEEEKKANGKRIFDIFLVFGEMNLVMLAVGNYEYSNARIYHLRKVIFSS